MLQMNIAAGKMQNPGLFIAGTTGLIITSINKGNFNLSLFWHCFPRIHTKEETKNKGEKGGQKICKPFPATN